MKKIVVLGRGFLGKAFEKAGFEVRGKEFVIEENIAELINYDVIINCIAKSNTRWCEKNFEPALYSNAIIPKALSSFCKETNKKFVHISTGCLYDGEEDLHDEQSFIAAHCNYTVTKWAGEKFCSELDLILRPRLLFADYEDKNNLLCKLSNFNKYVVEENSYTSVDIIVEATKALLTANKYGIYNVCCDGHASVALLAKWLGLKGEPMSGKELIDSQKLYLVNCVMDISKLKSVYHPPLLRDEVERCWESLKQEDE